MITLYKKKFENINELLREFKDRKHELPYVSSVKVIAASGHVIEVNNFVDEILNGEWSSGNNSRIASAADIAVLDYIKDDPSYYRVPKWPYFISSKLTYDERVVQGLVALSVGMLGRMLWPDMKCWLFNVRLDFEDCTALVEPVDKLYFKNSMSTPEPDDVYEIMTMLELIRVVKAVSFSKSLGFMVNGYNVTPFILNGSDVENIVWRD